jgi:hypothetical protein
MMPDPARATRQRGPPERRVVPVPPEWLAEFEARVMSDEPLVPTWVGRRRWRELLRYVRALERERDETPTPQ